MRCASSRSTPRFTSAPATAALPVPTSPRLKSPDTFTLRRTARQRLDMPSKVNGSAVYGMDVAMPGMSGIEATRRIKEEDPEAQVLILSGHEDPLLLARAVQAGAVLAARLPVPDRVGDLVDHVLAVPHREGVEEVGDRLRVEGARAAPHDHRIGRAAVAVVAGVGNMLTI